MATRTKPCDEALTAGRQRKAVQFLEAAETVRDFADDEADEAIAELTKVGRQHGKDLRVLLSMKTKAGYSSAPVSADQRKRAWRAAERLVRATR